MTTLHEARVHKALTWSKKQLSQDSRDISVKVFWNGKISVNEYDQGEMTMEMI